VIVSDFAAALTSADARRPQWVSTSGRAYSPGIGPHPESRTIELVLDELAATRDEYKLARTAVPYPAAPRLKCDLVIPDNWAIEVKMLRFLGDNGKPNDNILMHILSPYPAHRSALTDCTKLVESGFKERRAILIYGYDYSTWPMDPAIEAFLVLASSRVELAEPSVASFDGLVHPVHAEGRVFGWEVRAQS
jgi:hypothetical protein